MGVDRYEGPLEPGMVLVAPDNEGKVFRRDKLIAIDPDSPNCWIYRAMPCPMRRDGGTGYLGVIPEVNLRIVMRPE